MWKSASVTATAFDSDKGIFSGHLEAHVFLVCAIMTDSYPWGVSRSEHSAYGLDLAGSFSFRSWQLRATIALRLYAW